MPDTWPDKAMMMMMMMMMILAAELILAAVPRQSLARKCSGARYGEGEFIPEFVAILMTRLVTAVSHDRQCTTFFLSRMSRRSCFRSLDIWHEWDGHIDRTE